MVIADTLELVCCLLARSAGPLMEEHIMEMPVMLVLGEQQDPASSWEEPLLFHTTLDTLLQSCPRAAAVGA